MDFNSKYLARKYALNILWSMFSFTLLLLVFIQIKEEKLQDFPEMFSSSFYQDAIAPLYYWLMLTIPIDLGLRKLVTILKN
jgi:hypothetical protein